MDDNLCWICKTRPPGPPQMIHLQLDKVAPQITCSVFKDGFTCTTCAERRFYEKLEVYRSMFTTFSGESNSLGLINWQRFVEFENMSRHSYNRYDKISREGAVEVLRAVGILSNQRHDHWSVEAQEIHSDRYLEPHVVLEYFTDLKNAREYALAKSNSVETKTRWLLVRHMVEEA